VAEARHANAKATFERVEPLYRDGVVPRQSFDDAQAELATAEGMLAEATTRLGKNVVRAPFDGILGLRTVKAGEYVSSGDTIVQLTRIEPLELTFSVAEDDAHLLRNGQLVRGHVGRCGTSFEGRVAALDPTVDPATRTLGVLARVANERRELRPGMSARVTVEIGQREQALLIPHEALVRSGTRYLVWVVAEGVANQQEVVPASFSSTSVEIASGLEAGAEVVVAGHQKLRPGAPVVAQPWQEIDNPLLRLGEQSGDDC
jgi:membrane fusion protein (multidrug efflux system)